MLRHIYVQRSPHLKVETGAEPDVRPDSPGQCWAALLQKWPAPAR